MPARKSKKPALFYSIHQGDLGEESADFPDPRSAGEQGLLCVGGDLQVETLLRAYPRGIFPWPQEGYPLMWFCPDPRGVLHFEQIHWPRRFLRELQDKSFEVTMDQAFTDVVRACAAAPRKIASDDAGADGTSSATWILPAMIDAYIELFHAGSAHSFECWSEGKLVGGLYGVWIEGVFSGESMFHSVSGASKRCLHALVLHLQGLGVRWMDTQMVTPILKTFGGTYISREEYLSWIVSSQARGLVWR